MRGIVAGDPPARVNTFPSRLPLFSMDRIYARGFRCRSTQVPRGAAGRACRTTCRWSPSSSLPERGRATAMSRNAPARRPAATRALHPGHELVLLKGGAASSPRSSQAIDAARVEVLLETYIFEFVGSADPRRRGAGARRRRAG